jgi:hypothetical protein
VRRQLERKRIRELGGYVSYTGRILDDILVARSLGARAHVLCDRVLIRVHAHAQVTRRTSRT